MPDLAVSCGAEDERGAGDRDAERAGVREVGLRPLSRPVLVHGAHVDAEPVREVR